MPFQILNKYINVCGGLSRWYSGEESTCQCRRCQKCGLDPWLGKIPWSRKQEPTPVFLSGEFHRNESLGDYNPQVAKSQTWLATEHNFAYLSTFLDVSIWKPLPTFWSTTLTSQDHLLFLPERDQRSCGPPEACVDKTGLVFHSVLFFSITVASAIFVPFPNAVCGFLTWLSHSRPAESHPVCLWPLRPPFSLSWAGALCCPHLRFRSSLDSPSYQADDGWPPPLSLHACLSFWLECPLLYSAKPPYSLLL